MGSYSHGMRLKLQLGSGVGLDVMFSVVSILKSNFSDIFLETGLWWRSPHQHKPKDIGIFVSFIPSIVG
jgi:hypothetical protein